MANFANQETAAMHPLLNIAINAARQAGDIILRHIDQLDRIKITNKNHQDVYCEVDIKAEQAIIQAIHKAYPEHGFIAEESGSHHSDAETVWIIDPLDGTTNFLRGFPFYAVSIAIQVKNRIEHGVVYDPIRHECFYASRGAGARLNDRRIRVSKQTQLSLAVLSCGLSCRSHPLAEHTITPLTSLIGQCAGFRRTGAAALDLAYVASGRVDGFWEFSLQPWDIAAGSLLVQEAGGLITDIEGGYDFLKKGHVVAATPKVFKSLLPTLSSTLKP